MSKHVLLYDMEQVMLLIEDPDGVVYQNQVGGVVCWQAELKGILAPLEVTPEDTDRIMSLPYPSGIQGITIEIADAIDEILARSSLTSFLKVDRTRLEESWEAWVHVLIDTPSGDALVDPGAPLHFNMYTGPLYGFGRCRGVLTWPNSD
jgi:hypothetical protein